VQCRRQPWHVACSTGAVSPATLVRLSESSGPDSAAPDACFAGRYRIDSVLGSGGMGVVYAATHLELGVPLALKIIHPSLVNSPEARERFCLEARAGAALRSPHTLRIYDAGLLGSEECFIVMERLEGRNLQELVRVQGPLPVDVAVNYLLQACAGLAEAHSIGLVHRDVKPENLFLAQQGGAAPVLKLMDFGVARWRRAGGRGTRLTNPRSTVGSPCYQAPEQMQNAADVDERADIWALGLVLFELLTGYNPFETDSISETCWRVLQGPRPSLSEAQPRVDPGLERVFQRCIAMDREERFRSVAHLAAALRPFAAPRTVISSLPSEPPSSAAKTSAGNASAVKASAVRASVKVPQRSRPAVDRLMLAATFLLGAGLASAWHAAPPSLAVPSWDHPLASRGLQALREARQASSALLARADGILRSSKLATALDAVALDDTAREHSLDAR
jgi:eukaryotic-like serine/threonine-protein kinase